jgi:tetratricopeptide (TPR) repeat protein
MTAQNNNSDPAVNKAYDLYASALKKLYDGDYQAAKKIFDQLLTDYAEDRELLARVRSLRQACEERLNGKDGPGELSADDHYDRAIFHHNEGQFDRAMDHLKKSLERGGRKAWHVHYAMAAVNSRQGNRQEALKSLKEALNLSPQARHMASQDPDFEPLRGNEDFESVLSA